MTVAGHWLIPSALGCEWDHACSEAVWQPVGAGRSINVMNLWKSDKKIYGSWRPRPSSVSYDHLAAWFMVALVKIIAQYGMTGYAVSTNIDCHIICCIAPGSGRGFQSSSMTSIDVCVAEFVAIRGIYCEKLDFRGNATCVHGKMKKPQRRWSKARYAMCNV